MAFTSGAKKFFGLVAAIAVVGAGIYAYKSGLIPASTKQEPVAEQVQQAPVAPQVQAQVAAQSVPTPAAQPAVESPVLNAAGKVVLPEVEAAASAAKSQVTADPSTNRGMAHLLNSSK